jgi:hypothetical protein
MYKFVYTTYLPVADVNVKLTEFYFTAYKQVIKTILNDNDSCIVDAFNELIDTHSDRDVSTLTFLDKLIILLTIRAVCISPTLELSITQPPNNQKCNLTFSISDIVEKLKSMNKISDLKKVQKTYDKIQIEYGIPTQFFFNSKDEFIVSSIKQIIIDGVDVTDIKHDIVGSLPIMVYRDAQKHLMQLQDQISKVTLLSVKLVNQENGKIEITPDIFSNSALEFLKLCYKRDLISLYELEYFLTSKLNLPYEILSTSTFAELSVYIGMYNEEQKKREKEERAAAQLNSVPR